MALNKLVEPRFGIDFVIEGSRRGLICIRELSRADSTFMYVRRNGVVTPLSQHLAPSGHISEACAGLIASAEVVFLYYRKHKLLLRNECYS